MIIIILTGKFLNIKFGSSPSIILKILYKIQKRKIDLERKLKELKNLLDNDESLKVYNEVKIELDSIYDNIAEGLRIRSKCDWQEHGEKSSKIFLNLEKQRGPHSKIQKLISGNIEIVDETEIS